MTIVVKASEPHDFLALVPRLVGFHPQNSIVFVAFRGTRTCGAMRYDLPGAGVATEPRDFRRIATTLVGMFSKLRGIDAVVPVVFTEEPFETSDGPVFGDFVDAVVDRFEFSGFRVRDALCVAADGWGSYFDAGVPPAGHPLGLIEGSTVHAGLPPDAPGLGDIDDWVRLPRVDAATVERVARRLDALRDAHAAGQLHPRSNLLDDARHPDEAPTWLDLYRLADLVGFVEAGLDPEPSEIGDSAAALLIFIVASPSLRDVVLMQWAFDRETGERVYDDAISFGAGKPADSLDTARLMLGEGPRPDPHRVEAAIDLVKEITARAPLDDRPPLLCMLAWLNWALGRSSVAHRFVVAAAEIDEEYGLVEIISTMLDRGFLPEWAFDVR